MCCTNFLAVLCADPFFSDSDDVWNASARVATLDGAVPAAARQRMPSQPSQPGLPFFHPCV